MKTTFIPPQSSLPSRISPLGLRFRHRLLGAAASAMLLLAAAAQVHASTNYNDGDLLLVFRRQGAPKDVLFNLGSVSNYLGWANGTTFSVTNFNLNLVTNGIGTNNLTGVKYILMAGTSVSDPLLRVWLSDADSGGVATDETFSKWAEQRSKLASVGGTLNSYATSPTNSMALAPSDPGAYTSIVSTDPDLVDNWGGSVPFVVEQDVPVRLRLFELKVSSVTPKPASVQVGGFTITAGGIMTFVAGITTPTLVAAQPASQTVECGGQAGFLAGITGGDGPFQYQWYAGAAPVGGNSSTLTVNPVSFANNGVNYTVVVSNASGSVTSSPAMLTVQDTTPPALRGNIVVTRTSAGGATVNLAAADACDGSLTMSCTPPSGSIFPVGVTTVNCSATDSHANTASGSFTVTVQLGFIYQDGDLLLVFRKDGFSDTLFDLGTVSNYLGLANGTLLSVNNFDVNLVKSVYGNDLTGVKYILMAATTVSDPVLRVWLSDALAANVPTDETFSKWAGQRSLINAIGTAAASYFSSSNQAIVLPPSDPGSYTYIVGGGSGLDLDTFGGSAPFVVEQGVPAGTRLFELKVNNAKPPAAEVGGYHLAANGQMTFTEGFLALAIDTPPSSQAACASPATFTVSASGEPALSYQWYFGVAPVGGNSPVLTINPVSFASAGNYTVVVSNAGGSVTSSVDVLTVTAPALSLPSNIVVTRTAVTGAPNLQFAATGTDACGNSLAVTCNPPSGSTFPVGVTTVNCNTAADGLGNSSSGSFTVAVQLGFVYQDGDLLLVFRKDGFNDVLFDLGTVSNYLGLANGTLLSVTNFDVNLVKSVFGSDLTGVKYILMAATTVSDPVLRVWLSDALAGNVPTDETFSKWAGQRSLISAIGTAAASYFSSSNQAIVLPPSDPGSYTYIVGGGSGLDLDTFGGSAPFVVEQGVPAGTRLFELKVNNAKPPAAEVGGYNVAGNGQMTFAEGFLGAAIITQPSSQTVSIGGTATFSVGATGDALTYQWYDGATLLVGANSPTLTVSPAGAADAGNYRVVVNGLSGPVTSGSAVLTVLFNLVTGVVELQNYAGTNRDVTFIITGGGTLGTNALQTNKVTLTFLPNGAVTPKYGAFTLTVPVNTTNVSAKTDWSLRRRLPVTFVAGQGYLSFTATNGTKWLLGGDIVQGASDNKINTTDFTTFKSFNGSTVSTRPAAAQADITGDGKVNTTDFTTFKSNNGKQGDPQ